MPNRSHHKLSTPTAPDDRHPIGSDPYLRGHGAAKWHDTLKAAMKGRGRGLKGEDVELFCLGWTEGFLEKGLVR